jgi:hypothetical protein
MSTVAVRIVVAVPPPSNPDYQQRLQALAERMPKNGDSRGLDTYIREVSNVAAQASYAMDLSTAFTAMRLWERTMLERASARS